MYGAAPVARLSQTPRGASQPAAVRYPDPDIGVQSLPARAKAQRDTVGQFTVDYDFQFTDRVKESGITFVNHVVDDAGRYYKKVHYDHGTGIAAADVDGDGLIDLYFVNQVGGNQLYKNLGGSSGTSRKRRASPWRTGSA